MPAKQGMSGKKTTQPSISRFFAPQRAKSEEAVVIDLSRDEPRIKENALLDFKFDKNSISKERTADQQTTHEAFKKRLLQKPESTNVLEDESPKRKKAKSHFDQLTPLEQQFVTLKRQHPDKVLAIQVGYKFKFFGEDAAKVHKILNIMLIPGKLSLSLDTVHDLQYDRIAYCSIPDNRLHIHLKRLLDKGMKVGVIEQVEAAAIKNQSANKNSLFDRKMTRVYTSGTYIDDDDSDTVFKRSGNYIVGLYESEDKVSLVALQLVSGEVVYDTFQNDLSRNELETRLLHLDPSEFLIVDDVSTGTHDTLENFKKFHKSNLRMNYVKSISYQIYLNEFAGFFDNSELITSLDRGVQIICYEMINHLKEFNLETAFSRTQNFHSFSSQNYMILNNQTLKNLEIFHNTTNGEETGSLLSLLDHTRTKFGFRQLKRWISQPLINRELILERQDTIESLQSNYNHRVIEMFSQFLKNCQDLERSLSRIHFQKCSMKEIYIILRKLDQLFEILRNYNSEELSGFNGPLKNLFVSFKSLSNELEDFGSFLGMINSEVINDDYMESRQQKLQYFNSKFYNFDALQIEKDHLASIRNDLEKELLNIRTILRRPQLQYTTNNKESYLIEVRNSEVGRLPSNWLKFNSTKSVSRFFTPEVLKLLDNYKYHEELLYRKVEENFKLFLSKIDSHYPVLYKVVRNLADLDCFLSLASVSVNATKPKLIDRPFIELVECRNPILEMLNAGKPTIANDIKMSEAEDRVLIITGPNMGGKSSLIKQIAIIVIMAQMGCNIPVRYGCLGIFTKIFIRMGSSDNILKGESSFQLEMIECLNILKQRDDKSLILLDEIGRGTSTNDGFAIASSILSYLINETTSFVLFITHFNKLSNFEKKYENVKNYHMSYLIEGNSLTFLFKFVRGNCNKSYGINVARLTSISEEIIENAQRISTESERALTLRTELNWSFKARYFLQRVIRKKDIDFYRILDELIDNL